MVGNRLAGGRGGGIVVGARLGRLGDTPAPIAVLSRNGEDFPVSGATNVRAGTEYKVTTERPTLSLSVTELDAGSWVMFELPRFTAASAGEPQDSLEALEMAAAVRGTANRCSNECRHSGAVNERDVPR